MFFKIGVLKHFANFIGKHLCWSLFLIKLQASVPAAFSGEIGEIFNNTFFYRTPPVAVSGILEAVQECYSFIHIVGKMKEISRSSRCSHCSCKSDQSILEIMAKFMLMEVTET